MFDLVAANDEHSTLYITCKKCGEETENEYLPADRMVPKFKATCKKCKKSGEFRLNSICWTGLPRP